MGKIKVLSEHAANKIAAGEVIERPASIVKELVENSLDAGATAIDIAFEHGGKSFIRVSDNGSGMDAADLEMAFERHATSKIDSDEDLVTVQSYGFRGEALPSIAAVSRLKMISKEQGSNQCHEIIIEGGRVESVREAVAGQGTTVEIRDLFFNTPARRKFMKSENTEAGHMVDVVSYLALANLKVGFKLIRDGIMVYECPADQSLKDRFIQVWGSEAGNQLIELEEKFPTFHLKALIGKPSLARANRTGQFFFVNRRWVKSVSLSYAFQAGYHGRMMHGQYPVGVVFLEIDPAMLDVNIHPTKQEVKIASEAQIKSLIQETIARKLNEASDLAPNLKVVSVESDTISNQPMLTSSAEMDILRDSGAFDFQVKRSSFTAPLLAQEPILSRNLQTEDPSPVTKILGQIHQTFILAESQEGLILVDQHAAHERIHFEALRKNIQSKRPMVQKLLMDEIFETSLQESEILKEKMSSLTAMGFEIDEFGGRAFVVRSVPSLLSSESPALMLKHFLEQSIEGKMETTLGNFEEDVAAMIACKKKSYKAHQALSLEEMRALLKQLFECENPFSCPHGRPSMLKWSFLDLEKQFKRIL